MDNRKRNQNEAEYQHWLELADGGRAYVRDVIGRHGGVARYIKTTNSAEVTTNFVQEIYSPEGELIEIHEKYPIDKGHQILNRT